MTSAQNTKYTDMANKFNLQTNVPMCDYTSFRVGGPADLLATPKAVEDLQAMLAYASANDIPVIIIGGGTNVLVTDNGIRGLVIVTSSLKSDSSKQETGDKRQKTGNGKQNNKNFYEMKLEKSDNEHSLLSAMAGEKLSSVLRFAMKNSLSGLEFAAGIPGTLGGAIAMNAGGASGNMSDPVQDISILDSKTLNLHTIKRQNLNFSYRHLEPEGMIISATLALKPGNQESIEKIFKQLLNRKKQTQPVFAASAGCFFKNPAQGMTAGELIEKSGLKGMKMGNAMVSPVHANYIVNTGNATCDDILRLKDHIEKTVFMKFRVQLESEVRIEGDQI
jgi:UDP-N-acetylmuramate dehydrogenase